ncbi:MAG: TetR/AcrR family transcriptional regulator [Candidatus Cryosericum sp.]
MVEHRRQTALITPPPAVVSTAPSTSDRIVSSALNLFFTHGYSQTSVAMIARDVGISNSAFYRHFRSKEGVLFAVLETFSEDFTGALSIEMARAEGLEGKLRAFYSTILEVVGRDTHLYRVFTETEFNGYKFVRDFYSRVVAIVHGQLSGLVPGEFDLDDVGYYLLGSVYLVAVKKTLWESLFTVDGFCAQLVDFALHGIDARGDAPEDLVPLSKAVSLPKPGARLSKGERTEKNLLRAAEHIFGERGYWNADIYSIARAAGVAPGTTYLYFESKLELLSRLVVEVNEGLRRHTAQAVRGLADRRIVEVAALESFCNYIREHRDSYRVVREAEFVDKDLGRWYYTRLSDPYTVALERAMVAGEIRPGNPEITALALMGIGHWLGLRWVLWSDHLDAEVAPATLASSVRLVLHGLEGAARRAASEADNNHDKGVKSTGRRRRASAVPRVTASGGLND